MQIHCPSFKCASRSSFRPSLRPIVRKGFFYRRSDRQTIPRYYCRHCQRSFSASTLELHCYQKKRQLNPLLEHLVCSGVSQRRAAKILDLNRKTVVRRFRFLAEIARLQERKRIMSYPAHAFSEIQFDDLETSEHTRCKPLSVALAVDPKTRTILSFHVSKMPAKGHLSSIAQKKYGKRQDQRKTGWNLLFEDLKSIVAPQGLFTSDENPHYPKILLRHFPKSTHKRVLGGRGAITGQGELKKKRFDPIFSLNHTCAMLRANINRLFRRTWCTTKTIQGLQDHLALYAHYHNRTLVRPCPFMGAS